MPFFIFHWEITRGRKISTQRFKNQTAPNKDNPCDFTRLSRSCYRLHPGPWIVWDWKCGALERNLSTKLMFAFDLKLHFHAGRRR